MEAVLAVGNRVVPDTWGLGNSAPKKLGSRFGLEDEAALPERVVVVVGFAVASNAGRRALLAEEMVAAVMACEVARVPPLLVPTNDPVPVLTGSASGVVMVLLVA
jgi:hypothetical protein